MEKELMDSFLNKTLEYLNSAEAFLQKNVPAFVEEMLVFDFYEAVFGSILTLVIVFLIGFITYKSYKVSNNKDKYDEDERESAAVVAFVAGGIFIVVSLISIFEIYGNLMTAVKIKVAPRVYLVEKISEMVKK